MLLFNAVMDIISPDHLVHNALQERIPLTVPILVVPVPLVKYLGQVLHLAWTILP
jgi:hypothetical protein